MLERELNSQTLSLIISTSSYVVAIELDLYLPFSTQGKICGTLSQVPFVFIGYEIFLEYTRYYLEPITLLKISDVACFNSVGLPGVNAPVPDAELPLPPALLPLIEGL